MQITSVERNKKNKDRLSVFIDGRYAFSMSEDDYLSMNLYEEREITEEEVQYIRNTVNFNAAKTQAVRYLTLKLRTEDEVLKKLTDSGFDKDTSERVLEELKALGYINNMLYVRKYVFDRSKLKPVSKKLLKYELLQKGISEDDIDSVLDEWKLDESEIAEGLARKKFGKYDLYDEKIVRRVYSFLAHRGFEGNLIMSVIDKLKNGEEA